MFVMGCRHDEHRFDRIDTDFPPPRRAGIVTALWLEPGRPLDPDRLGGLRLVQPDVRGDRWEVGPADRPGRVVPLHRRPSGVGRRTSPEVRRRRTLLAVMGLLLAGLALPLGGTGGHSHATGSVPAGTGVPVVYTVQPGDSLWSIAERTDPSADPRPLVARLAAQTGSDTVTPGERIVLP
jgi:hypothetical protein